MRSTVGASARAGACAAAVSSVFACGGGSDAATTSGGSSGIADDSGTGTSTGGTTTATTTMGTTMPGSSSESDSSAGPPVVFDVAGVNDLPVGDGTTCSGDLKYVLAENGSIVEACAADEGCLDGQCVAACAAASGAKGSMGCEFVIPTSAFVFNGTPVSQAGPCHALLVSNPWDRPAQLQLSRGGDSLDVESVARVPDGIGVGTTYGALPNDGIPSGQVAVVFLSHKPGTNNGTSLECPITPAVLEDTAPNGSDMGVAFELVSDTPIQVYDIIPYGGAASYLPSASLIFPSTAWGDNYLVVAPHPETGPEWMAVVARDDGTTISINPKVAITAGTIANPPPNMVTDYELDAGEVIQFQSTGDPAGSIIAADRPIGLFTGNAYLLVTTADNPVSGQDSAHQMIPDVNALGSEYVGAGLYSRLPALAAESVRYRLVGVVDNTDLDWDAAMPAGAVADLDAGQVVEFESRELFTVRSQDDEHPFALTQYMSGTLSGQPGCGNQPGNCQLGDEEWVMLVPPAQFLRNYAFFVDPTYGTTTLVVTRTRGTAGFSDVDIACMGTIDSWMPVGDGGIYEVAHVELFRAGVGMVPACETSQHVASSAGAFGVTVWGTDQAASYGYPAGGGLASINGIVLDPAG
ncbi:MAG: IgGFc-binding protein [Nannocystaceae bacterium]|nr:IgGFc-binding protein [Nannocystaceae bacterium]